MQTKQLQEFFTDIALDPTKYGAFMVDPEAGMRAAGLGEQSQSALKSKDEAAIVKQLVAEGGVKAGCPAMNNKVLAECPGPIELFKPLK